MNFVSCFVGNNSGVCILLHKQWIMIFAIVCNKSVMKILHQKIWITTELNEDIDIICHLAKAEIVKIIYLLLQLAE
jgi:hypothetical protein